MGRRLRPIASKQRSAPHATIIFDYTLFGLKQPGE